MVQRYKETGNNAFPYVAFTIPYVTDYVLLYVTNDVILYVAKRGYSLSKYPRYQDFV